MWSYRIFLHAATNPSPTTYRKFGPTPPEFGDELFYPLPNVVFGTTQVPPGMGPLLSFLARNASQCEDSPGRRPSPRSPT